MAIHGATVARREGQPAPNVPGGVPEKDAEPVLTVHASEQEVVPVEVRETDADQQN